MKKILLISNRVMHYRVSVYNYFFRRFRECGIDFILRSNALQKQNPHPLHFDFREIPFNFKKYREEIKSINPDVVILFLHQKDIIYWPLIHWLKFNKIPVVYWNKAINYDAPDNKIKRMLFHYLQTISDSIILYAEQEIKYIGEKNRYKVHIAKNTINFEDFPEIQESKEAIKEELGISFKKVVLSVGSMGIDGGRKKISHLVEIFNDIERSDIGLVIVGSGMNEALLGKRGKNNIVYLGEIHDPLNIKISKIFKMADLFSIPGHVGLALNQAFYWGLPVITEEGAQPPEINYLINGRNGFVVPQNDLAQLRQKILFLLDHEDIRQDFSRNAKEDILNNASIENMFRGFKECADSLLSAK